MLCRKEAQFDLAVRLRSNGATLGEVFSFLSGLYFRGKLAYANRFASPPNGLPGVWVITPNRGLVAADATITLGDLRGFNRVDIDERDPRYCKPLKRDLCRIASEMGTDCEVVLLGSIATGKYVTILQECLQNQLRFPGEFVGRGDMSRGGLMLRCVADNRELDYILVANATRHGPRPAKLAPRPGIMALR